MPYDRQSAGKGGHSDIVKNPDVDKFLSGCDYIKEPTDEEGEAIASEFIQAPDPVSLPEHTVASDASLYLEPVNDRYPSTQIGYIKLSMSLVDMNDYNGLANPNTGLVNPFKVAKLHRNASGIAFTLPGSNVRYGGEPSVQDGFRRAVWEQLSDKRTQLQESPTSAGVDHHSVADTLFHINGGVLEVKRCPSCAFEPDDEFVIRHSDPVIDCPECGRPIYGTDSLRLFEEISDFGTNASPVNRFMNAVEHLMMANFIRRLAENHPEVLSEMAFVIDGPLAIFGQPAWISKKLMAFYYDLAQRLRDKGLAPPVIVGLQKQGMVMDHARAIEPFIGKNRFRIIDDNYRKENISAGSSNSPNFGDETYYGQDFIFKTDSGQVFVLAVPYPFRDKRNKKAFALKKGELKNYPDLGKALDLIRHFEFDLYESAIVPIALAHRHASISLVPGGKVLDFITKTGLGKPKGSGKTH